MIDQVMWVGEKFELSRLLANGAFDRRPDVRAFVEEVLASAGEGTIEMAISPA